MVADRKLTHACASVTVAHRQKIKNRRNWCQHCVVRAHRQPPGAVNRGVDRVREAVDRGRSVAHTTAEAAVVVDTRRNRRRRIVPATVRNNPNGDAAEIEAAIVTTKTKLRNRSQSHDLTARRQPKTHRRSARLRWTVRSFSLRSANNAAKHPRRNGINIVCADIHIVFRIGLD